MGAHGNGYTALCNQCRQILYVLNGLIDLRKVESAWPQLPAWILMQEVSVRRALQGQGQSDGLVPGIRWAVREVVPGPGEIFFIGTD